LLLIILLLAFGIRAQNILSGKVIDKSTGLPIIGATVFIDGTTEGALTDIDGKFQFEASVALPFDLVIHFMGYEEIKMPIESFGRKLKIQLKSSDVMLKAVEVVDRRITEKQQMAALTVESMDVVAIKEAPSGNFYEGLGNMKEVDLTSASLGFKVINTRGFNSTSPVRSLQLIDGVDNQSPGLNFSLGNFLGASDLDVKRVNIIAGASSAFYGPGAFNGVIQMETKSPFLFKGLDASVKFGERDLVEAAIRWADVVKNKKGEDKFGYKLNLFYFSAYDWEAVNYAPVDESDVPEGNPGGLDAVNVYGDEGTFARNNDFSSPGNQLAYPGLGTFYRTGYREPDLADYDTRNFKGNVGLYYNITPKLEVSYNFNYCTGTTVYQGENRFSLKDIQFFQHKFQIGQRDKWFIRAYSTSEDAGNSYDIVTTAIKMQESAMAEADWNLQYFSWWQGAYSNQVRNLPGYPVYDFGNEDLDDWSQNRYEPWLMQPFVQDSLTSWHADTRTRIDTMPPFGQGVGRYEPGTDRFDSAFSDITGRTFTDGGSLFYDKSALYHIHGEYIFELPENLNITVGANGRLYRPDTRGTIFSDTLQYTYATDSLGERIAIDSSYTKIENSEYGIYIGVQKPLLDNKLTLSATIRMDKNENFDHVFSPAFSAVYAPNKDHVFRATFTSAVRNPTLADQYLYYDVGRAILLGNLNGYDSLVTIESFVDYVNTFNRDTLEYFSLNPIKPERVRSVELGYRGIFWDKLYLDLTGYYSWYYDFIGYRTGIDTELSFFGIPIGTQVYRLATNSDQVVVTRGFSTGVNYYFNKNYSVTFNYSFNELTTAEDDPIIPAYNTPRNKFNIGFQARGINMSILSGLEMGFGANYKWIEGFVFEGSPQFTGAIDSYGLLDAQVNWTWSKINTTLKIGASNVLDNRVYQVYGGPQVGRLAYVSILYSWIKN
jgi:iron complex outermembrane receptor protein